MSQVTSVVNRLLEKAACVGRKAEPSALTGELAEQLHSLQTNGFAVFNHLVGTERLAALQADYVNRLENKLEFETPVLAQSKVDPERDADLIRKQFLATPEQLEKLGLTFSKSDVKSYAQAVEEYKPSTLTVPLPDTVDWFSLWLDEKVTAVASAYMGFMPQLVEAYIRRNFPARFPVMNHAWHRDTNHETHLLKMFVFLNDCTIKTGPHHYISGTVQDRTIDGKTYYSDEEIYKVYPPESGREVISVVPAGTLVLEDTRGLHRAGIPEEGYRDLGFATFVPPIALRRREALYHVGRETFEGLSETQRAFVPQANVVQ